MGLFPTSLSNEPTQWNDSRSWWVSLIVLCAILGALVGLSFKTQNRIRHDNLPAGNYPALAQEYLILKKQVADDQRTIKQLNQNTARLENSTSSDTQATRVLTDDLNQTKFLAGLTDAQGPGVVVTLTDSKRRIPGAPAQVQEALMIHDRDISAAVNELKAAGAEAISVNGQRLVAVSPVRCAGNTVLVNNIPQTPPYAIKAIGDPKTLQDALNLPGGFADNLRNIDPAMIRIEKTKHLLVPAYAGATQPKYARPVAAPGTDADKKAKG